MQDHRFVHSTVTMKMVLPTSNSQYIKGLVKVISRLSDAFALKPISFFSGCCNSINSI